MKARYPGYDVLAKRRTPSWNEKTRRVIDQRLAMPREPRFFTMEEFQTLEAVCARIVPQPAGRPQVPTAPMIDEKLYNHKGNGKGHHAQTGKVVEKPFRHLAPNVLKQQGRHDQAQCICDNCYGDA